MFNNSLTEYYLEKIKQYVKISPTLGIGSGLYEGYKAYTIIGYNPTIGTTLQTIAEGIPTSGSNLDITFPASASTLSIASTNANDTSAGTGARSVLILGLDGDRKEITELVATNGQNSVETTNTFLRVNQMLVISVGSTGKNEGIIYCSDGAETYSSGIPQNLVYHTIGIGTNISMVAIFSVASTYDRAIGIRFVFATDANSNKPLIVQVKSQNLGFPEYTTAYIPITLSTSSTFPLIDAGDGLPANADTRIMAQTSTGSGNNIVTIYYTFVLKDP